MDRTKTGELIRRLRKESRMTQLQLAERLHVSDKTVSKWERGLGCPEVSLLGALADILGIDVQSLLSGELSFNETPGGNMKRINFYVCPDCGNLLTATNELSLTCCGRKLKTLLPVKAANEEKLCVENIENDYFISSAHEMTKEHFITFVALLTPDTLILKKQYPEWDLQVRIPAIGHGRLFWHCSKHGLFYQLI